MYVIDEEGISRRVGVRERLTQEQLRQHVNRRASRWREKNKEKHSEYMKRYAKAYVVSPEKKKEYARRQAAAIRADPVRYARMKEKWRLKSAKRRGPSKRPTRIAEYKKKRRRGKLWDQWKARQLELQDWRCAHCKGDLKKLGFQVDHIVPRFAGGGDEETNLWMMCPRCNRTKHYHRTYLL